MFKKLLIVSSLTLLGACASQPDEDYGKDAVASSSNNENSGSEVIGKEITPVNLIEQNLSLTESELFVTVRNSDDPAKNKSTVEFSIEYTTDNLDPEKDDQVAISTYDVVVLNSDKIEDKLQALIIEKKEEKKALEESKKAKNKKKNKKDVVEVAEPIEETTIETLTLESSDGSQSCSDETCQVTQTVSFDVDTQMLLDAQENGFVFLLKPKEGKAFLETMIPASYLKALLSGIESKPMSDEVVSEEDKSTETHRASDQQSAEQSDMTGEAAKK